MLPPSQTFQWSVLGLGGTKGPEVVTEMPQNSEERVAILYPSIGFGSNSLFLTQISPDMPGFFSGYLLYLGKCCTA